MRVLIVVSGDLFVRSFVGTGALAELEAEDCTYVVADTVRHREIVEERGVPVREVHHDPRRYSIHAWMRENTTARLRFRSHTFRIKANSYPLRTRLRAKLVGLPGVFGVAEKLALRKLGPNLELRGVLEELRPDVVVVPSAGVETLMVDAVVEARRLGVPSIVCVNGWDNLSSKASFAALPDVLCVWGPESVDHAHTIHRMPRDRVFPIGVPTFRHHFAFDPERHPPPFDFPYVLFAGCQLPFDEATALRKVNDAIARSGHGDLKIVYRPHPWRIERLQEDDVRELELEHVVFDEQVADAYARSQTVRSLSASEVLPRLDYYPALLGNARAVICPLSTMVVEASILERNVLVLAYDDGIHPLPPSRILTYTHFQGLEDIPNYLVCHRLEELERDVERVLAMPHDPDAREHIRRWLHHGEDTYAERLGAVVRETVSRAG
jgi:hypothetical protein